MKCVNVENKGIYMNMNKVTGSRFTTCRENEDKKDTVYKSVPEEGPCRMRG